MDIFWKDTGTVYNNTFPPVDNTANVSKPSTFGVMFQTQGTGGGKGPGFDITSLNFDWQ